MNAAAARRRRFHRPTAPDAPGLFFRDFLRRPKQVGSIIPSSRFLERRVARSARLPETKLAVELGPGTGGTTRAFLSALPADAKLLVIEINPRFAAWIRRTVRDPRLHVAVGDAAEIASHLAVEGLGAPEVVLSGIPFSTMPRAKALEVLASVRDCLAPGGRFVAYQMRDRVGELGKRVLGEPEVELELRNVPPMRVFRWEREAPATS